MEMGEEERGNRSISSQPGSNSDYCSEKMALALTPEGRLRILQAGAFHRARQRGVVGHCPCTQALTCTAPEMSKVRANACLAGVQNSSTFVDRQGPIPHNQRMTMRRQFFLFSAAAMLMGVCWHAGAQQRLQTVVQRVSDASANAEATTLEVSGTITDGAGNPVAGATVEYWRYEGNGFRPSEPKLEKQITTGTDGAFGIQVSVTRDFSWRANRVWLPGGDN